MIIKNGTLYTMAEEPFVGDIQIVDGKIKKVAKEIKPTKNEEVIDATNCWVLPGFIDGHTHLGMHEAGIGYEGNDVNEMVDPVTPQVRAIDGCNPMDVGFEKARSAGITMVMSGPGSANVVGGEFTGFTTYGKYIDDMIIEESKAMKCAFGENPKRVYGHQNKAPRTRMGTAAIMRKTLTDTINYMNKKKKAQDKGESFDVDIKLEAMIPVIEKKIPLKAHAHRADDILTSIRIAKEFDVKITLDHCTEGDLIVDKIVEGGYDAFVGPTFLPASKFELKNKGFHTAVELNKRGVKTAIITDHPVISIELLPVCAGYCYKEGMPLLEALKSITLYPAQMMGIGEKVGSLEKGKLANITIYNDNPLSNLSRCLYTIAEGNVVYKFEEK